MIKKVLFSCVVLVSFVGFPMENLNTIAHENFLKRVLKNGKHISRIHFYNAKTGYRTVYIGDITVKDDIVVSVALPERGAVRSGRNNLGYIYKGGTITFEKNSNGKIVKATAEVSVKNPNGHRYFKIKIDVRK